jgi:glycosyltransferase involved in cell wall biosynthesis
MNRPILTPVKSSRGFFQLRSSWQQIYGRRIEQGKCNVSSTLIPLFINRFSLSPRTAVGVQTVRLLNPYDDWVHFHWWSSSLKTLDHRSILLENPVLSRYSFLHNPVLVRLFERLGLSAWSRGRFRSSIERRLISQYRDRVGIVYVAPLSEGDAQRCLRLVDLMDAPFVLHLWDVLEGDIRIGALRELVDRAHEVFCLSRSLVRDVAEFRPGAELLLFSRDAAMVKSHARQSGPLKIVMHGNVSSYAEGLDDLAGAIALLERKGLQIEVSFLGSPKILRQAHTVLRKRVKVHGFFATQEELDRALSQAHVGFLPGPKLDPRIDLRSRYSVPSRIVDYMAVELPIVGTVHKASATAEFALWLGLDSVLCAGPEQLAERLERLFTAKDWLAQKAKARQAFARLQSEESPVLTLKRRMEEIADQVDHQFN